MSIVSKVRELNPKNAELWINEAEFGFSHIEPYCENLSKNARVLEIGCGVGILLSMLVSKFDTLTFEGIEPFGDGFSQLRDLNRFVQDQGVKISPTGFEDFGPNGQYDLIFCVNVFEHVDDWRQFIDRVSTWLKPDARLIILCPNYGFPFESHFGIPIIWNKPLTARLYRNFIRKYENDYDCAGLWASLNFVRKKQVKRHVKRNTSLEMTDHISIVEQMIARLTDDPEFRKRQKRLGPIAVFLKRIGVLKLILLFPNILPYMKLELKPTRG